MGFEVSQEANLVFARGTRLAGSTVVVSLDMSIREYSALLRTARRFEGRDEDSMTPEDIDEFANLLQTFGDQVLVRWDLMKSGTDVPATGEGMNTLPMPAAMAIFQAWSEAVSTPDPKADDDSASGEPSADDQPSDATAASSPSPAS